MPAKFQCLRRRMVELMAHGAHAGSAERSELNQSPLTRRMRKRHFSPCSAWTMACALRMTWDGHGLVGLTMFIPRLMKRHRLCVSQKLQTIALYQRSKRVTCHAS